MIRTRRKKRCKRKLPLKKTVMTPSQRVSSKLNKIVSSDDTDSGSPKFVVYAFLIVPRLDLVCILYFLSVNNYLHMLTSELDFASF